LKLLISSICTRIRSSNRTRTPRHPWFVNRQTANRARSRSRLNLG